MVLTAAAIWRVLIAGALLLALLGAGQAVFIAEFGTGTPLKDLRHFNLDSEMNFGAWFSSMMMLCSALLLMAIAARAKAAGNRHWLYWALLAAVFALFSLDETTSIHETAIEPLRGALDTGGIFYWAWVIPALILVPLFAAAYIPFLLALPRRSAALFITAGGLFVSGALGFELLSGLAISAAGETAPLVTVLAICEETLEMLGLALFTGALADHAGRVYGRIGLAVSAAPAAEARHERIIVNPVSPS